MRSGNSNQQNRITSRGHANAIGGFFMCRLFCIALLVILASGCMTNNEDVADEEHYDKDGYMGITSANPSLVATPNSHNYARDIEMMKRALKEVPNIRKSTIMFDGGYANIHIHVDQGLTPDEAEIIRDHAQRKLSEMIPQYYKIRVTVDQ